MECSEASSRLADLAVGELSADERAAIEGHLQGCPPCLERWNTTRRAIGAYRTLAPYEPAPQAWTKIAEAIRQPQGVRRPVPSRRIYSYLYAAVVAAMLLVAISSLAYLAWPGERPAAFISFAEDGPVGEPIPFGETVTFDTYKELTIPGYGLAYVREGTSLKLERPMHLDLRSGEAFFVVHRSIAVGTAHGSVSVRGTSFGVRAGAAESTVYVADGRVDATSKGGGVASLVSGDVARFDGSGVNLSTEPAAGELLWLAEHRPARIDLVADGGFDLTLELRNNSVAPLALLLPDNDRAFLVAAIDGLPPIDLREAVRSVDALRDGDGRLLVDADHPARITCAVPADVLPRPGRYAVRIAYYALRDPAAPDAWSGRADAPAPVWWETSR